MAKQGFIGTAEAMKLAGVTRPTIIVWARDHGIGAKVVGRWQIDAAKLAKLIGGSSGEEKKAAGKTKKQ